MAVGEVMPVRFQRVVQSRGISVYSSFGNKGLQIEVGRNHLK